MQVAKKAFTFLVLGFCFYACTNTVSSDEPKEEDIIPNFRQKKDSHIDPLSSSEMKHSSSETSSSSAKKTSPSSSSAIVGNISPVKSTMTDSRDGKTYKTITLGAKGNAQTWMAENLNYYDESDATLYGHSWCYDNVAENCEETGRFYTWAAAVGKTEAECGDEKECNLGDKKVQGVCPSGWHLPHKKEWETLFSFVGGQDNAGKLLKSKTGWEGKDGVSGNGTDAYDFSVLPAGYWGGENNSNDKGRYAFFWTATENGSSGAYVTDVGYTYNQFNSLFYHTKMLGLSVRCLQDY